MKRPTIISLGEVLWDVFPDGEQFGGAPANFACHAAIQSAKVAMVSAVGNDWHGHEAIKILRDYSIDTNLIQTIAEAATGTVSVTLDSAGKPTFNIHENSAWDFVAWTNEVESQVREADAIYFGTLGQRCKTSRATIRRAIELAGEAGVTRILDINLRSPFFTADLIRESVQLASILKLSDDELPEVISACGIESSVPTETQLRSLLESSDLECVVMTCGAKGAILVTPGRIISQQGISTKVIDTVGAGDSFAAAFLLGVLRNEPHDKVLHAACEKASVTCSHGGAVPSKSK